jgi:hypothetical protein
LTYNNLSGYLSGQAAGPISRNNRLKHDSKTPNALEALEALETLEKQEAKWMP